MTNVYNNIDHRKDVQDMIDWATEELVGINTISPDNVAVKSIEDETVFDITLLYHDGEEVTSDKKVEMQRLLEEAEEEE